MFGDSMVVHILMTESDHSGLLIRTSTSRMIQRRGTRRRPFRYENMWRRHHSYYDTISEAWSTGCTNLGDILANLGNVHQKLTTWNHDEFGNVRKELFHLRQQLEEERKQNPYSGPSNEECHIMNMHAEVLVREEIMVYGETTATN
jgi:hypothetical protein